MEKFNLGDHVMFLSTIGKILGIAPGIGSRDEDYYLVDAEYLDPTKVSRFVYDGGADRKFWEGEKFEMDWSSIEVSGVYAWIGQKDIIQIEEPLDRELRIIRNEVGI